MRPWLARTLVFGSSAAVLVIEILAGRLLAPYIGVSLDTFTGIIGVILAGIAIGAWGGGVLADGHDPSRLIGPALVVGGALTWLSLPIVRGLGPELGSGPPAIVLLTAAAFLLPAIGLSSVSPMVAKMQLADLGETGTIIGGLSAVGTLGALAGTFITGFVLISAIPTRPIVMLVGGALIVGGAATHWMLVRRPPTVVAVILVLATGLAGAGTGSACEYETTYACVNVVIDENDPSGRSLYLDRLRHAYVDLDDITHLDIRYIRLFAQISEAVDDGAIDSLHVGGGGFSFPRYLEEVRPGSTNLVLEIDSGLVEIVEDRLGLVPNEDLVVRTGDARLGLDDLDDDRFDLVIGDAFGGSSVPWHLTTREFISEIERVLHPSGFYVMNVIDGGDNRFARAEAATLRQVFDHVAVILPPGGISHQFGRNQVFVASQSPLPPLVINAEDGVLLPEAGLDAFIDGADPLRDDFAPVDQLVLG